jgi:hypothetical protein
VPAVVLDVATDHAIEDEGDDGRGDPVGGVAAG